MEKMINSTKAAEILGISPRRVAGLAAKGSLPAQKIGNSWVFSLADVKKFAQKERPAGRPWPRSGRKNV